MSTGTARPGVDNSRHRPMDTSRCKGGTRVGADATRNNFWFFEFWLTVRRESGRFPFDQIFRFEIPGIPCDEWNSNFPVRSINQSQAIGFQVSRENTRSNGGLIYLCLLALVLLNDSEVKINDVLGEGDNIPFIVRV